MVDGAAAAEAERNKRSRYPAVADLGLQAVRPFAIESFGRLGDSALQLLGEARQRVGERAGLRGGTSGVMCRWLGLLQYELLRAQHDALVAMAGVHVAPLGLASAAFHWGGSR